MIGFMVVLFAAVLGAETKVIPMPDLLNVEQRVYHDKTQMYITHGTSIYIYSLKDFKLVKKFGKQGEGPSEFMFNPQTGVLSLFLSVYTEDITVHSAGKVSWFTKDGIFKKTSKLPNPFISKIQPFGKNLIGIKAEFGQESWQSLCLYDDQFNELKNIVKMPHPFQPGKGTRILEGNPTASVYGNTLFTAWDKDFIIKVFDTDINELYTIKRDEKRRKITEDLKKEIIDYMKTSPESKDYYEFLKPFTFPEYFPSIGDMSISDDTIYVLTFTEDEAKNDECIIMDLKGKLLKRVFLPLKKSTPLLSYPYFFREGSLYQIVENEDEEQWEMQITEIK